jgi:hypothetical protein
MIINNFMDLLPIELWKEIFNISEFLEEISLAQVCTEFHNNFHITDFYNIPRKYAIRLTDENLYSPHYLFKLTILNTVPRFLNKTLNS